MHKYKYILFDLDRTLWDFEKNAAETFSDIYRNYQLNRYFSGLDHFLSEYNVINEKLWGQYRNGLITKDFLRYQRFRLTLEKAGIHDESLTKKIGDDYVFESPKKKHLFPGAIETLEYLKNSYLLYIITNGFKEVQEIKLRNTGLYTFFKKIYISEDIGFQKPDIRVMKFVLEDIPAISEECLMIGDDVDVDVKCAADSGIDQVLFNPDKNDHAFSPTYTIFSLIELKNIL